MTIQHRETLIIAGRTMRMDELVIPENHPWIERIDWDLARSQGAPGAVFTTACWRRYLGTWEIRDSLLYLLGLEGMCRMTCDDPIHAAWYTGTIRAHAGELIDFRDGYNPWYEEERTFLVEAGVIRESRHMDFRIGAGLPLLDWK
ncbi:hypothetical protein [Thioalkalivibrio thiocyanodenitrificans]|uniref:hypothetical protein n=1 Tax=Thioalkalivibrio thiocyanodenitrificans TaxID=243063 RepID=UPI0003658D71|nr:hypothetical protein [Thioalkalivibrio thiocyanodenitrificans]